jgi:hypothetical protein
MLWDVALDAEQTARLLKLMPEGRAEVEGVVFHQEEFTFPVETVVLPV